MSEVDELIADMLGSEPTTEDKPAHEQRQYHRYKVSFKVFIRLTDGGFVTAQAVDLSMGGVYIEYGVCADVNKKFDIAFDLTFKEEFKWVLVKAKIVRSIVIVGRDVYGLVMVFGAFTNDTDSVLKTYIEKRAKQA